VVFDVLEVDALGRILHEELCAHESRVVK
jgi:hypothetical protein